MKPIISYFIISLLCVSSVYAAEKYNGWYVAEYQGECFDVFVDNEKARFTGDIGRMTMKNRLSCSGTGSANSISGTWREKTHPTSGECYLELTVIPPRRNIRSGHYLAIADYHQGCDKRKD